MSMHIGTGGWDYFQVEGLDSLTAYSKAFDFVEVNSTFYSPPSPDMVRSWRRRVRENFVFSVRCHRDLTHKYLLFPCRESYEILNYSLRICDVLRSGILHIQTPPYFKIRENIKDIRDLLSSFDFGSTKLAWEIRGNSHEATGLMQDFGIIHCTDISKQFPAVDSDILYSRLFGHGKHNLYQFDDAELLQINDRIRGMNKGEAYLTFHGARMYKDAARLRVFHRNGTFPGITKATGLASLKIILEEDARFPAAKNELMEKQGWKVFDLSENEHVHARTMLEKLPDREYTGVEEVIEALGSLQ